MTKVYGASDDLIEFEGDVYGEVSHFSDGEDDPCHIFMEDGTLLRWHYDDEGIWRASIKRVGTHFLRIDFCTSADANPHSDVVHFKDGLKKAWATRELELVK